MIPEWVIFAVIAGLGSNAFNALVRYFIKDKNEEAMVWTWFFETVRFIVFAAVLVFDFSINFEPIALLLLVLVGLTELGGSYFSIKMHVFAHLSISSIISRTRMIWIPIIAFFLLNEHLLFSDYVGIAILFLGISITVAPHKFFVDKGATYANLASIFLAFNTTILKAAIPYASYSLILASSAVPSVLFFPMVMKNAKKTISSFVRTRFWFKIATVTAHIVSMYFFLMALNVGEASKVNAIYQGMLIASVLFGIIVFKEREDITRKLIGAAVTIVGIMLIA